MVKQKKSFWNPLRAVISVAVLLAAIGCALWLYLQGKNVAVWNPQGVIAQQEKDLLVFTLLLSAIVVVPVYAMLFTFAWRYREGNHKKVKYTPNVGGNRWIEAVWWAIPIIIIGILCVVTWVSTHQLDPSRALDSKEKPLRVQVVALEWKWLFLYPDYHVASLNELTIPAKVPVNFELTSDGPMSAFWVPNLGTQTYAMTGMSAQLSLMADNPGTFRGSNSNISGEGYSDMYFNVRALPTQKDFIHWAKSITTNSCHQHLTWGEYAHIAIPSVQKALAYYHLHDDALYARVINKYMSTSTPMQMQHTGPARADEQHERQGGSICGED